MEAIVRRLFAHKWVEGKPAPRFLHPYRTCERCGVMQRGIYDPFWKDTVWEIMRERAYVKSEQIRIVRESTSRLDKWVRALGLRRTRRSDSRESSGRAAPV